MAYLRKSYTCDTCLMIMHQGDNVHSAVTYIWRIKFYNGEREAHSLVRSLKYSALVWSLALQPILRVGR